MKLINEVIQENRWADVFTIEEFAEIVSHGCIISYDGYGYYHDGHEKTDQLVDFEKTLILSKVENYPYVCWYNK